MTDALAGALWPVERIQDALAALGARAFGAVAKGPIGPPPEALTASASEPLDHWLTETAHTFNLETEPVLSLYRDVPRLLATAGPALIWVHAPGRAPGVVALLSRGWRGLKVIDPSGKVRTLGLDTLTRAVTEAKVRQVAPLVERMLESAQTAENVRERTRKVLLDEQLSNADLKPAWLLRERPTGSVRSVLRASGAWNALLICLGLQTGQMALAFLCWWLLGRTLLTGSVEAGWFGGWGLTLGILLALQWVTTAVVGFLAVQVSAVLRKSLLAGSLEADVEEVRAQGAGRILGVMIESQALDPPALTAVMMAPMAAVDLLLAGAVLSRGVGGGLHALLLAAYTVGVLVLGAVYLRRRGEWTDERFGITGAFLERMLGHRTRLVQEYAELQHESEDEALARYVESSRSTDVSSKDPVFAA